MDRGLIDELCVTNIFKRRYVSKEEYFNTQEDLRYMQNPDANQYVVVDGYNDLEKLKLVMMARQTRSLSVIKGVVIAAFVLLCIGGLILATELPKLSGM
jgi:hypothetical protein